MDSEVGALAFAIGRLCRFPLTPASLSGVAEVRARRGARKSVVAPWPQLPRPAGAAPRKGHRLRLPRPRVSPAFFTPLRIHAIGHSAEVFAADPPRLGCRPLSTKVTKKPA